MTPVRQLAATRSWRYCRQRGLGPEAAGPRNKILVGDAETALQRLPAGFADVVVTSPPYHLLRRYDAGPDEIGTEPTVGEYVQRIVAVCDQLVRVLKPSGVMWLNLGDSFSRHQRYGTAPKSLLLAPERILLALSDRGWIVRSKVVWAKPNPMPASVGDRLACTWEPIYLLTRSPRYFFDLDAIREPHRSRRPRSRPNPRAKYGDPAHPWSGPLGGTNDGLAKARAEGRPGHPLGRNPGDVWSIATNCYRGAHFAVYPEALLDRPIRATCPERVCARCGLPWGRPARRDRRGDLHPTCDCRRGWRPGLVLDPFIGAGTTAVAAERHRRDWLGIELRAEYAQLAEMRITAARRRGETP